MSFSKILEICEKQGFLKIIKNHNSQFINIGPVGGLLQENLYNEWFFSTITNRDANIFLNKTSFVDTFQYAKETCFHQLPFGIADIFENKNVSISNNAEIKFENFFANQLTLNLRCTMFVSPFESTQMFHQWQRQRKMWWRKFSALPGRYSLTDIQTNENGAQNVEIHATYPWGTQLVESLNLQIEHEKLNSTHLQTKDQRKKVEAHCVTSNVCLSTMLLNTLCDAFDEPLFKDNPRPLFHLHRKLAPYKISFVVTHSQKTCFDELSQLALYLCKQLRANRISTLLVPSAWRLNLDAQWQQYDQLGIPYNIHLNEKTLKDGISLLRSRDTTLKEQVHVSELADYIEKLFKNY